MQEYIFDFDDLIRYIRRRLCVFSAVIAVLIVALIVFFNELRVTYVVCDEESQTVYSFLKKQTLF